MSIKTAIQSSLTAPRPRSSFGTASDSGSAVSDTLDEVLEGVAEIERHAKQTDPRNTALFAKLAQIKVELQAASAQAAGAGMARLGATLRGSPSGSSGSTSGSPF